MNVNQINACLLRGELASPGLFPHLEDLAGSRFKFEMHFGLDSLPEEEGVLLVRGPRQYGKSTWLESRVRETVATYGPGSALYLNGDEIRDADAFASALAEVTAAFPRDRRVRRLFVDEITAIRDWQRAIKRAIDAGEFRGILVVTTGSKATDLRRGSERLPGRRGKLDRTTYLFTPISFAEFRRVCGSSLGDRTLAAYLLSGGCPAACNALAEKGHLPEYLVEMIRDWIYGECAASGRQRSALVAVMESLLKWGGSPVGQAKLSREAGLANNTVAAAYVELLSDLMCVGQSLAWDASRRAGLARRPAKYPMTNLLVAIAWGSERVRSVYDFERLPADARGKWWEWLVAQELWRRAALRGDEFPERMHHWQSPEHEIDFVLDPKSFLEVKGGRTTALEFSWFEKALPGAHLTVVGQDRFNARAVTGNTMEEFLLQVP